MSDFKIKEDLSTIIIFLQTSLDLQCEILSKLNNTTFKEEKEKAWKIILNYNEIKSKQSN